MKRTATAPYQKPDIQILEAYLKQIKALLFDGSLALNVYIDRIVYLYLYNFKPRKYVEELEDTVESNLNSNESAWIDRKL